MSDSERINHSYKQTEGLVLHGRLQYSIARTALAHSGYDPASEQYLATLLSVHSQFSNNAGLQLYNNSPQGIEQKQNIVASLRQLIGNPDAALNLQQDAEALLSILAPDSVE